MKTWKNIAVIAAVLAIVGLGYIPSSSAGEKKSIEQMITEAKTPADHEAIAAFYEKQAKMAHKEHTRHQKMRDLYAATPALKAKHGTGFSDHCDALVKHYEDMAKQYEAMAQMHKEMAKAAQ
ncbi:MAG: hypothetical protein ACRERD_09115 [Candidatus Binatia bacterium]